MKLRFKRLNQRFGHHRQKQLRRFHSMRRHPVVIPIAFFVCLAILTVGGLVFFNHGTPKFKPPTSYIVIISRDHETQTVPTNEPTVGSLLDKLHISLNKDDRVEPDLDTPIVQDNLRVNIYRAVPIEVVDGGQKTFAMSAAATSRSLVTQAGVKLYPEDNTKTQAPAASLTSLVDGGVRKKIIIDRATPVLLDLYSTTALVRTHAKTVGDLVAQKGIILADGDRMQPSPNTVLKPEMQIYLLHKGVEVSTSFEQIPMPVKVVRDNSLSFGTSAIRQRGSPGKLVVTYRVKKKDGKVVGKTLLQKVIITQPVAQIVAQGQAVQIPADKQAVMARAGVSPGDYKYVDYIASHEGGWCPTKIQGTHACPGYAPNPIPSYGGYGIFQATPGGKMASAGRDWATSAVTQIRWATGYADGRYGSWYAAYQHKTSTGWW